MPSSQLASIILLIERRLPKQLTVRSGFPGSAIGLVTPNWYIRVQEIGELKKITHTSKAAKSLHSIRAKVSRMRTRAGMNRDMKHRNASRALSARSVISNCRSALDANSTSSTRTALAADLNLEFPYLLNPTHTPPLAMEPGSGAGSFANEALLPSDNDDEQDDELVDVHIQVPDGRRKMCVRDSKISIGIGRKFREVLTRKTSAVTHTQSTNDLPMSAHNVTGIPSISRMSTVSDVDVTQVQHYSLPDDFCVANDLSEPRSQQSLLRDDLLQHGVCTSPSSGSPPLSPS